MDAEHEIRRERLGRIDVTVHRWRDGGGSVREVRTFWVSQGTEPIKIWRDRLGRERHTMPERRPVERCRAWARSTGRPCRAPAMTNGRCRNHGGLSTGPLTPEGKARSLANLAQYRPGQPDSSPAMAFTESERRLRR